MSSLNDMSFSFLLATFIITVSGSSPKVSLGDVVIEGVFRQKFNFDFESFLGIPYAKAPIGELRFKDPEPYSFTGNVFFANKFRDECIQYSHDGYTVRGVEDCLYMNVFRPKVSDASKTFDVIVHIHGGAFMFGKPSNSAKLVERGFIFVNFCYRLGPMGFMSTGDDALPGNLGLKDQVAALKWVKKNIAHFNGNPDSITLAGLSAGSVCAQLHMMSPMSLNLFHRVIMNSGSSLNPWALAKSASEKTRTIARALNCTKEDSFAMVECLRTKTAKQIVDQVPKFMKFLYIPFSPFGPVVETSTSSAEKFLPGHPYDLLKEGKVMKVPVLNSLVTGEGLYPVAEFIGNKELLHKLEVDWTDLGPYLLDFNYTTEEKTMQTEVEEIRKLYLHDEIVSDSLPQLTEMVGDRLFGSGIVASVLMFATVSDHPVYMYRFGYSGSRSLSNDLYLKSGKKYGVSHDDDDFSLFIHDEGFEEMETVQDQRMRSMMLHIWQTFASKGIPQLEDGRVLSDVRTSLPLLSYLEIEAPDNAHTVITSNLSNIEFWRPFIYKESVDYMRKLSFHTSSNSPQLQGGSHLGSLPDKPVTLLATLMSVALVLKRVLL